MTQRHIDDQVCALLSAAATRSRSSSGRTAAPVPKSTTLVEAAGLPETLCTVYSNVFLAARLAVGETLLIDGGAAASARWRSSWPTRRRAGRGDRRTQSKLDACRELGADIMINYREDDFVESLMAATDGHGADVILDIIGASYLARNIAALAPDGGIANIGMQQGRKAELDFGALMAKRGAIISTSLGGAPRRRRRASSRRSRRTLAGRRLRRDPSHHRHRAADARGRGGAPDHDRLHPHGQDRAARQVTVRTR